VSGVISGGSLLGADCKRRPIAPTVISGAEQGAAVGVIAGQVSQGNYLNTSLDSFDFALGLASTKYPRLLVADTAYNLAGGSKQVAKLVANVVCRMQGRH
jgi:hypothetical protein